jgi:hypothetical protein
MQYKSQILLLALIAAFSRAQYTLNIAMDSDSSNDYESYAFIGQVRTLSVSIVPATDGLEWLRVSIYYMKGAVSFYVDGEVIADYRSICEAQHLETLSPTETVAYWYDLTDNPAWAKYKDRTDTVTVEVRLLVEDFGSTFKQIGLGCWEGSGVNINNFFTDSSDYSYMMDVWQNLVSLASNSALMITNQLFDH